jgi:hypothetical protein
LVAVPVERVHAALSELLAHAPAPAVA